jgi:hypothetical protein
MWHQRRIPKIQPLQQALGPLGMTLDRVDLWLDRLVGAPGTEQVGNTPKPASTSGDEVAVQVPQVGLPCTSTTGQPSRGAPVEMVQPPLRGLEPPGLVRPGALEGPVKRPHIGRLSVRRVR